MELKKLLVTTDLSEASECALQAGAELARRFGAEVTLLTALDFDPQLPPGVLSLDASREKALKAEVRAHVEEKLDALAAKHFAGITLSRVIIEDGAAAHAICHFAEQNPHDLLLISTHGRTGLKRMLLGSVAERVVRSAPCPVMTLRPPE